MASDERKFTDCREPVCSSKSNGTVESAQSVEVRTLRSSEEPPGSEVRGLALLPWAAEPAGFDDIRSRARRTDCVRKTENGISPKVQGSRREY